MLKTIREFIQIKLFELKAKQKRIKSFKRHVSKMGYSYILTLPSKWCDTSGIKDRETNEVDVYWLKDGNLIIKPIKNNKEKARP